MENGGFISSDSGLSRGMSGIGRLAALLGLSLALIASSAAAATTPHVARRHAHRLPEPRITTLIASAHLHLGNLNPTIPEAAIFIQPQPPRLSLTESYYEEHAERVQHDLLFFTPDLTGTEPPIHLEREQDRHPPALQFAPEPYTNDPLQTQRDIDRLVLFEGSRGDIFGGVMAGVALFGASSVASAHAPAPFRVLFDRQFHVGPAIFPSGGMGAGVGGLI